MFQKVVDVFFCKWNRVVYSAPAGVAEAQAQSPCEGDMSASLNHCNCDSAQRRSVRGGPSYVAIPCIHSQCGVTLLEMAILMILAKIS